jgi:ABC-type amino acid transport substrate-binding protein
LKTEDRETFLFYPAHPTYTMVQSLTVLSTNKLNEIQSINDLDNTKIGYLFGANIGPFLSSSSAIQFEFVSGDDWIQKNLAKLLSGRIDAALDNNAYSYLAEAKKQGVDDKIKTIPLPGKGTEFYVVFSKKSSRGFELVQKYNDIMYKGLFNEQIMIEEFLDK